MKYTVALFAFFLLIVAPGCGIPSNGIDEDLKGERSYHQANDRCANLDLSQASMSPAMMRGLMGCLNANEQLPEINALVQSSTDAELAPVADAINRLVLSRPDRLSALDQSFQQLDSDGTLALTLEALGRGANHAELAPALMRLAGQIYFGGESGILAYVMNGFEPVASERLLAALGELGRELEPHHVSDALDMAIALADVRAGQALQRRFRQSYPVSAESPSVIAVSEAMVAFLLGGRREGAVDLGARLLDLAVSGDAFAFADHIVSDENLTWTDSTPHWGELITELYARDARFLKLAPSFFAALSRTAQVPVRCMSGTSPLVALTPARVFQELNSLSLHQFLSTVATARPFCDFPAEILTGAQALNPLSVTSGAGVLENWVRFINTKPALLSFLVDAVAQGDRLALLEPAVKALSVRAHAPTDLMLFLTAYKLQDRELFQARVRSFLRSRPALGNRSLYTELSDALQSVQAEELAGVIDALTPFINDNALVAGPLLTGLRTSFHANNVHPWVDLLKDVLSEAPRNREFFTALFKIAARNQTQFTRVVREFSAMCARDDDRMRGVLTSLFALFRPTAERARVVVNRTELPARRASVRHDLIADELHPLLTPPRHVDAYRACRDLDLSFSLADYADERFMSVFANFQQCLGSLESDEGLVRGLTFLVAHAPTEGTALAGRSLFAFAVDTLRQFGASVTATAELVTHVLAAARDGSLVSLSQALHYWTDSVTDLVGPLLRVLSVAESRVSPVPSAGRVTLDQHTRAQVCATVFESEEDTGTTRCEDLPLREAIRSQLALWEPEADVETRTSEIIAEFEGAAINDGALPLAQSWAKPAFLALAEDFHDYLINPRRDHDPTNSNEHKVVEALLDFAGSLNARMSNYDVPPRAADGGATLEDLAVGDALAAWVLAQANRLTVMPYHYEGEVSPRVRLVSNLDRLGLVMVNSDIRTRTGAMPAVLGLTLLRLSWADEPTAKRPDYAQDDVISFTLSRTIEMLLGGLPSEGACARNAACVGRMRNLKGFPLPDQVEGEYPQRAVPSIVTVLEESLTEGDKFCGRRPLDCVGLKVIRNLFTSIWDKTPDALRPLYDDNRVFIGARHNVNVAVALSRLGVFRKATLALYGKTSVDDDLRHFMKAAIILGRHPERGSVEALLKKILLPGDRGTWTEPRQRLTPLAVSRIFDVIASGGSERVAKMAYYGVAAFSSAGLARAPTDLLSVVARTASGLVSDDGGRAHLVRHIGAVDRILGSAYLANLMETFHGESLTSGGAWSQFRTRYGAVRSTPEYPREGLDVLLEDIVSFLEAPPAQGSEDAELYHRTLEVLLRQLESGETEALLRALGRNPQAVQYLAQALGRMGHEGTAQRFIEAVSRLMNDPQ